MSFVSVDFHLANALSAEVAKMADQCMVMSKELKEADPNGLLSDSALTRLEQDLHILSDEMRLATQERQEIDCSSLNTLL